MFEFVVMLPVWKIVVRQATTELLFSLDCKYLFRMKHTGTFIMLPLSRHRRNVTSAAQIIRCPASAENCRAGGKGQWHRKQVSREIIKRLNTAMTRSVI